MIAEGIEFMAIGMGTVFGFLSLLVAAVQCASWLIARTFPAPPAPAPHPVSQPQTTTSADTEVAVILAAAHRWRQQQGD